MLKKIGWLATAGGFISGAAWYVAAAAGILATLILIAYLGQRATLATARGDVKLLRSDLKAKDTELAGCNAAVTGYKVTLGEQKKALDKLKADGLSNAAEADEELKKARRETARQLDRAARAEALQRQPTPAGAGCKEAVDRVRGELK